MKIETTKEKLLEAVSIADRVTGKHVTLPILSNILLSVSGRSLCIRATNLDIGLEIIIPVKVEEEGEAVVPGGVLSSLLQGGDGASVTLSLEGGNLVVKNAQSKTLIKSYSSEDFPTLPKVSGAESVTLRAQDLVRGFRAVWYSASTSTIKPELASVYLTSEDGKLVFAATDSFRLAEKTVVLKKAQDIPPLLIPSRNVPEIIRVLEGVEADVELSYTDNQLSIHAEGVYVTSRLIEGTFPDYRQIIPKEHVSEAVALKHDMLDTLKRANVFSDKFHQVHFDVKPSKKQLTISSSSPEVGETSERVSAALSGEDLAINFNLRYILDCFQSVAADSVSFAFSGPSKPLLIRGVSDASFLYLVMPMNR